MNFSEYQAIAKMLDTAECLITEALRRDCANGRTMKKNLLDAQYHIDQAIDSLKEDFMGRQMIRKLPSPHRQGSQGRSLRGVRCKRV